MKRLVPKSRIGKVGFFAVRVAKWQANAEAIGADPALVAQLAELTASARAAYNEQQAAEQTKRSATLKFNQLVKRVERIGSCVVSQVRTCARSAGNSVYPLASIPAPNKRRTRLGPPGTPYGQDVELGRDGALTLTWKCKHPRGAVGTMYRVSRRVGSTGKFEFLAAVGERKFRDITIPRGSPSVMYHIQAIRSTVEGQPYIFNVNFGGGTRLMMNIKSKRAIATALNRIAA